jgi:outer membrane protein, heavy metal efflux system
MFMLRRYLLLSCLWAGAVGAAGTAQAQLTSLADDIILISKGVQTAEETQRDQHLGGPAPDDIGGSGSALGHRPGSRAFRPREGQAVGSGYREGSNGVLQSAAGDAQHRPTEMLRLPPPTALPATPQFLGALDIPEQSDEGPPNGLTLDVAMAQMVQKNFELKTKAFEIPQARADVLTASLLANPLVFGSVSSIPYQGYSPQRPGEITYSATVIYPFDVGRKRVARTEVATQAQAVIEALYTDAVRDEIERLNIAFVDVVAARETLRYARASRDGLKQVARLAEAQLQNQRIARPDLDRIGIQLDSAEIGVEQSEVALRESKHVLGLLLATPAEEAERIELRGSINDTAPPPPPQSDLQALAKSNRPDLVAYRLGIRRAQADVKLAQAEGKSDLFVLWSPWELQNNTPVGGRNATSWSVAAFGSLQVFNRNQGNVRRAELNVAQTRTELEGLEQQVAEEVHSAYAEYQASRAVVVRLEQAVLPRSRRIRDASARLLALGETSAVEYLAAQREHNDVVRQYRDALIRHRRSMLRLNTAVGQRILP